MSGGRRGRRLWMRAEVFGGSIPVYVVRELLDEENGQVLSGLFDQDAPCILILQSDNVALMKQSLHHELMHVCFRGHAGSARETVLDSRTPEGREAREEAIVSFLEPVQFDLLVRNGWLKYPNPPRVK